MLVLSNCLIDRSRVGLPGFAGRQGPAGRRRARPSQTQPLHPAIRRHQVRQPHVGGQDPPTSTWCSPPWRSATGLSTKPVGALRNSSAPHAATAPQRSAPVDKCSPLPTRCPTRSQKHWIRSTATIRTKLAQLGARHASAMLSAPCRRCRLSSGVAQAGKDLWRGAGFLVEGDVCLADSFPSLTRPDTANYKADKLQRR